MRRLGVVAGVLLALFAIPATRADDGNQACTNADDVTIVVDFAALGGGVNVRCAPQPIQSGFDVLERANVAYDHYKGFVCRIAGKPENEACNRYPPSDAYWVYWIAEPGGEWKYSKYGAGARKPPKGSLDGWAFHMRSDATPEPVAPRYPVPPARTAEPGPTTATTIPSTSPSPTAPGATNAPAASARTTLPTSGGSAPTTVEGATTTTSPDEYEPAENPSQAAGSSSTTVKLGNVDLSVDGRDGGSSVGFILSAVSVVGVGAIALAFLRARGR